VIDKDLAAAQFALDTGAHRLLILTDVEQVALNWGKPDQRPLHRFSAAAMKSWFDEGQFPDGSMGPKIQAALRFLAGGGREVIITLPETSRAALDGKTGTHILP
jgi:carbamate kinase